MSSTSIAAPEAMRSVLNVAASMLAPSSAARVSSEFEANATIARAAAAYGRPAARRRSPRPTSPEPPSVMPTSHQPPPPLSPTSLFVP